MKKQSEDMNPWWFLVAMLVCMKAVDYIQSL